MSIFGYIVKPPKAGDHPLRTTTVSLALRDKKCQSCASVDHMLPDGAPYIDKNDNIHIRVFCASCGSITKWKWDGKTIEQK